MTSEWWVIPEVRWKLKIVLKTNASVFNIQKKNKKIKKLIRSSLTFLLNRRERSRLKPTRAPVSDGMCHMTVLGSARLTVYILVCRCDSVSSVSRETSSSSSSSGSARWSKPSALGRLQTVHADEITPSAPERRAERSLFAAGLFTSSTRIAGSACSGLRVVVVVVVGGLPLSVQPAAHLQIPNKTMRSPTALPR